MNLEAFPGNPYCVIEGASFEDGYNAHVCIDPKTIPKYIAYDV